MPVKSEKTTPVQQQRVKELKAANEDQRIYTYRAKGKTITDQFRRYVTRQDASYIGQALYGFLMGVCGFSAEYALVPPDGGFRIKWAEPAKLIHALPHECRFTPARSGHPTRVYADGQTDVEVLDSILAVAAEHQADCLAGCRKREYGRDVSAAIKLLEPHQFTIVPAGWRLVDEQDHTPQTGPPGSLAEAIHRLANRNGVWLAEPTAVEAGGQTRLL